MFEAVILVLIVVYIFLQSFRATIIPMLTVPVSLLGVFIMFPMLGFSVNTLTMFGLVLAIGIVVDDAIVVVEAVQHHIEHGLSPVDATRKAMKEVSGPVVAIALVLCAVFVPVAFMGGVTGRALSAVCHHHRGVRDVLRDQRAHAQPGALRHAAARADTRHAARSPGSSRSSTPFFDWIIERYGRIVGGLTRKATFSMLLLVHRLRRHLAASARLFPADSFRTRTRVICSWRSSCRKAPRCSAPMKCSSRSRKSSATPRACAPRSALRGMNILNSLNVPELPR